MIRTQISFDDDLYRRGRRVARKKGVSLAELCRRGLEQILGRERVDKPWMAYAGVLSGDRGDSSSVDDVVCNRMEP